MPNFYRSLLLLLLLLLLLKCLSCSLHWVRYRPATTSVHEFSPHSHARPPHHAPPLTTGEKTRLSAIAGLIALTNHCSAHRGCALLTRPDSFILTLSFRQSSRIHPTGVIRPDCNHCIPSRSLSASMPACLLASSPSCFHPLHFHSVAAALHSKESETYN